MQSPLVFVLLLAPPMAFYLIMLLGSDSIAALTREDGYVETFCARCLLASLLAFLMSFRARHNVFCLLTWQAHTLLSMRWSAPTHGG